MKTIFTRTQISSVVNRLTVAGVICSATILSGAATAAPLSSGSSKLAISIPIAVKNMPSAVSLIVVQCGFGNAAGVVTATNADPNFGNEVTSSVPIGISPDGSFSATVTVNATFSSGLPERGICRIDMYSDKNGARTKVLYHGASEPECNVSNNPANSTFSADSYVCLNEGVLQGGIWELAQPTFGFYPGGRRGYNAQFQVTP